MSTETTPTPPGRPPLFQWLARVNGEVSQWVASTSWWRLIVLLIVMMVVGGLIGDMLHLKHESIRVPETTSKNGKNVTVTIGGYKITKGPHGKVIEKVPADGDTDASAKPTPATPDASEPNIIVKTDGDDEDDDITYVRKRVITAGGILGDLGSVVMVILFGYLVAAKIIVKKVAQADEKVRTANDAAEREAMERQLVQAKLQVLQAQVEPHFLFNTLAAVDYLIETEPPRASKMQKALITYLRGALPQLRQESSTLGREMRLIRSYLELLKMRMEDRLTVEYSIPESLESAEFPPMMLQSLVENAIKHGIEPKPEGGTIRVAAGVQNTQLWVEVSDTGVGVPDGDLLDGPTTGTGIGLQNIRERLAMLFPGKSRLMLISDPAKGTVLKISVPYSVGNTPGAAGKPAGAAA